MTTTTAPRQDVKLAGIVDADTIIVELADGTEEKVNLLGIDCPEPGQPCSDDAVRSLNNLLRSGPISLEFDAEERESHGRLVAYVFAGSTLVNKELVHRGLARAAPDDENTIYEEVFAQAEQGARGAEIGQWDTSTTTTRTARPTTTTARATTTTSVPPSTTMTTSQGDTKVAKVSAGVSDASPRQYTEVTAYAKATDSSGRAVPGATVTFVWHYKTVTHTLEAITDSSGVASCTRYISGASKGYKVVINVAVSKGGGTATSATSFTPW